MKIKDSELCDICGKKDYIEHFFVPCDKLKGFWSYVELIIEKYTGVRKKMSEEEIITGVVKWNEKVSKKSINKMNHIVLIAKSAISKMRYRKESYVRDILMIFDEDLELRQKYLLE